ncbi:MAG: dihydrodipicolinate reductase [Desulfobacterales bacterium]|nr:dihydrodipicolinate reductase [Desulfobacteraceae bacterium]MBT4363994.1 dihydrodipicolinate reductase [Desulfobacteraceae bacterium]MBT7086532.1 dihydrodipicolinate reductase [Desulfobacterales bacterium]MBT7697942.1 dihydrodipicolinate reductase [Desulfobacterales bacterium]
MINYKVVQWSSGNVGGHAVKSVVERGNMELVGLYVYSDKKAGKDAGEIVGLDNNLGVKASKEIDEILSLDADVVIHTPLASLVYGENKDSDIDDICRLLASGKNVISTVGYMYPKVYGPELYERLENACKSGNSTFHSTGVNPGYFGDVLPLTMSSLSKSIESIHAREITSFEFYPSPQIMFDIMGFGKTDEEFNKDVERFKFWLTGLFKENIQMVADGLEVELEEITEEVTFSYAENDLEPAAGLVKAGTIAGQFWQWAGVINGEKRIIHETVWRMHNSVAPDWPTGNHSITIEGEPFMHVELEDGKWADDLLLATAMHAVNAIPYIVNASPGVKTFLDLPLMIGKGIFKTR